MTNSGPANIPTMASPPKGSSEKSTTASVSEKKIDQAAEEGRLVIRAADLAPKIIEALSLKFGPDKVVGKIAECMDATKTMAVGGKPFETPDFKTRLDALKLLLQYQIGMPVARTEAVVHNVDTMHTLENKMQKSPALRRAVGRMLDRSKFEDGEVIDTNDDLSDKEIVEAEEVLQSVPEQPETDVEMEVRTMSNENNLKVRGRTKDIIAKYAR